MQNNPLVDPKTVFATPLPNCRGCCHAASSVFVVLLPQPHLSLARHVASVVMNSTVGCCPPTTTMLSLTAVAPS